MTSELGSCKIIMMTIIETPRLYLRQFTPDDAAFVLELLNTPAWLRFIGDRGVHNLEDASAYITNRLRHSYAVNGFGFYAMVLKQENIPMGMCGLVKREGLEDVDIGFALLPAYENLGFGYEAAAATLDYARAEIGLKRIVAITLEDNLASIKLLKKIGLQFEQKITLGEAGEELLLFAV